VRAFRDYELIDEAGRQLGTGVSQWMILNMKNRRPMRMPKEIIDLGLGVGHHLLPADKDPFIKLEKCDFKSTHVTGRYDLDMNNHVNNVKYIEWMTGYLPEDTVGKSKCHELKIQYHRETTLGNRVTIKSQRLSDQSFLHNIHDDTGSLLAEGISNWR
jgi:medium-chain acyl-[acyl-carrier-protein] hydrolase